MRNYAILAALFAAGCARVTVRKFPKQANMNKGQCGMFAWGAMLVLGLAWATGTGNARAAEGDFTFAQLSDTHWGFHDPKINPDYADTLKKAIAAVNALDPQPDFIVFTGDLTHTTDDPQERRKRLNEFKEICGGLKVKDLRFLPGEHDAGLDNGAAFKEVFGQSYYTFEHKGINFIVIDNVSDPASSIGDVQLQWLGGELKKLNSKSKIVVFTHRPLFELYPQWDWWTKDGQKALDMLTPFASVNVFYGHIHQVISTMTGHIAHHAATGLMYALPAPGSVPKKAQIPWNPAAPYKGLGFRTVEVKAATGEMIITEHPVTSGEDPVMETAGRSIQITAKRFEYSPNQITIKKGVPVTLELTSLDRTHGFNCPGLGVRADIEPGKKTIVRLMPQKTGVFEFHCDVFCGEGHEGMTGEIIVED